MIADYGGDFRAAIDALLKDNAFLIREIEYASLIAGHGYARGWKPEHRGIDHGQKSRGHH
ncbi:hypothetical protein PsaNZ63_28645 [Pseudomonas syringae pv. actinidiae]|nr:hypothetical protein PsaNZ63_28645 [Pseudomonas syringae pv. actinidiae]